MLVVARRLASFAAFQQLFPHFIALLLENSFPFHLLSETKKREFISLVRVNCGAVGKNLVEQVNGPTLFHPSALVAVKRRK